MAIDRRHEAWLRFVRKVLDVPLGINARELRMYCDRAKAEYPTLVPIIEAYISLASRSEMEVEYSAPTKRKRPLQMHLFDLLREKTFFPQNLDLARFAFRVVPDMRTYRFDKMSRSDIAARVIEFLEQTDPSTRDALEASMREALGTMSGRRALEEDRQNFLSKWERIIKGMEI